MTKSIFINIQAYVSEIKDYLGGKVAPYQDKFVEERKTDDDDGGGGGGDVQLYSIRWWICSFIVFQAAVTKTAMNIFGVLNDVFAAYFGLTYSAIDWLTIIRAPTGILTCVLLAWLSVENRLKFKRFSLITASCCVIGCVCLVLAFSFPRSFILAFVGNLFLSVEYAMMHVLPTVFAILWFPDHQIGTALGLNHMGATVGSLVAFVVFIKYLPGPASEKVHLKRYHVKNSTEISSAKVKPEWFIEDQKNLLIMYGILLILSVIILVFMITFAVDQPTKPPTVAQMLRRAMLQRMSESSDKNGGFLKQVKDLLTDQTLVKVAFVLGIVVGFNLNQIAFKGEIIRKSAPKLSRTIRPNVLSGYLLALFEIGSLFGLITASKVVDRFKNYKMQAAIAMSLLFISSLALIFGYTFNSITALCISNWWFGFFLRYCIVPMIEIGTQQAYPKDVLFVGLIIAAEYSVLVLIISLVCRAILDYLGSLHVLLFQAVSIFLTLIILYFTNPEYRRLNAERRGSLENVTDSSPLLANQP